MASEWELLEDELYAAAAERPRNAARFVAALEKALEGCRTDPDAAARFAAGDLYLDLCTEYEQLGRYEDALAAADAVVKAGLEMAPDPRCLRAEILMRTGRVAEAEPIWAAVLADTPDDVWLYNNAGIEYAATGDHATALDWYTPGLQLALQTGDPERVAGQLLEFRRTSLDSLGRPTDELQRQAVAFCAKSDHAYLRQSAVADGIPVAEAGPVDNLQAIWVSVDDYEEALELWPDFAAGATTNGPDGRHSHAQYCRAIQRMLVERIEVGCTRLTIAPIRLTEFNAWCAAHDRTPDRSARKDYLDEGAPGDNPAPIPWPPGRNEPCWCGSGRKYKKCCGAPSSADTQ